MATIYGPGSENFPLNLACVIENKTASFYGSLYVEFGLYDFVGVGVSFKNKPSWGIFTHKMS